MVITFISDRVQYFPNTPPTENSRAPAKQIRLYPIVSLTCSGFRSKPSFVTVQLTPGIRLN